MKDLVFMSPDGAAKRVIEILDIWKKKGYDKLSEVPEGDEHKKEFTELSKKMVIVGAKL